MQIKLSAAIDKWKGWVFIQYMQDRSDRALPCNSSYRCNMGKGKEFSDFDKRQIITAKRLGKSISESIRLVNFS